MSEVGTKFTA